MSKTGHGRDENRRGTPPRRQPCQEFLLKADPQQAGPREDRAQPQQNGQRPDQVGPGTARPLYSAFIAAKTLPSSFSFRDLS